MDDSDIARLRLANQFISKSSITKPELLVSRLGAMQAQAYQDSLWGVGLRCEGVTRKDVEEAIAEREIIRTWAMRGTWHLVPPSLVWSMLSLYPQDKPIPSYQAKVGLSESLLRKGLDVVRHSFEDGNKLTYEGLHSKMAASGMPVFRKGDACRHVIRRAARMGIICFDGHVGAHPAFTLLERMVPKPRSLDRERALGEIAKVYFRSHGPATAKDFAWWAGIKVSDARLGILKAKASLKEMIISDESYWMGASSKGRKGGEHNGRTYLLPAFDEYLIAYVDRRHIIEPKHARKVFNGSALTFRPIIVSDGEIVGTWMHKEGKNEISITLSPFEKLSARQNRDIREEAEKYGAFIGKPALYTL